MESVDQHSPLTDAERGRLREKYRLAPWSCAGGLYGSKRHVALQRSMLKRAVGGWGRLLFVSDRKLALVERLVASAWRRPAVRSLMEAAFGASLPVMDSLGYVHGILKGIPTDYFLKHAYYRNRQSRPAEDVDPARDRCGLIWFAPVLPCLGSEVVKFLASCRARFQEFQSDFYVAMLMMNPRAVVCLMSVMYDQDDSTETLRAKALHGALLGDMHRAGYEQYRAGLMGWAGLGEDSRDGARLVGRIKSALDPAGTLAPGRYGID